MPALLDKLDQNIAAKEAAIAEAAQKAEEKRAELTNDGKDALDIESEDFKAATEELAGFYAVVDDGRDELAELKAKRTILGRREGEPVPVSDVGGESKGLTAKDVQELISAAKGEVESDRFKMGSRIIESPEYKALQESGMLRSENVRIRDELLGKGMDRAEFKDLISGTGVAPFKDPMRTPFQPLAQRAIRVLELLQTIPTDQESIKYAQMSVAGHNPAIVPDPTTAAAIGSGDPAVTDADAGLKPESAYEFVTKTADIETLAHTLPIHKNQLADVPGLETILNEEMVRGLYLFLESEVVAGNGTDGHLTGILNTSGIVSQAKSTDSTIVALHKALTGCRLLFEEPNLAIMHPTLWQAIRLLRDGSGGTADSGGFLFGPPSQAGDTTLWGMNVITTPVVPIATPIVGDFSGAQLYLREGVSILASDSHADFFIRNLIMLLAEMRVGFGIRRPGAFGKVTGAS